MSAQVHVLTFLSKTHIDKGRYAVSVEVVQRKKIDTVKKKRKEEEQVYIEHESVVGSCSPEFELTLTNKKCDIQFSISGALKPQTELEEGEDILEYNSSLSECRRLLTLVPTWNQETQGNATIKFKVGGKVKHTVSIHEVPMIRSMSTASSEGSFLEVTGPETERQTSVFSGSVSSQSLRSLDTSFSTEADETIDEGSVREHTETASGEGHWNNEDRSEPFTQESLDREMANLAIRNNGGLPANQPVHLQVGPPVGPYVGPPAGPQIGQQIGPNAVPQARQQPGRQGVPQFVHQGPQYVPPVAQQDTETAYDRILCNESLNTLSWALPSDASRLLIGLRVPNSVLEINRKNHHGDVVSANYHSFLYWRSQKSSRKQEHDASNQQLYEDLLVELQDIGRKDIKGIIKQALEENKKLDKKDFARL